MEEVFVFSFNHRLIHMCQWADHFWKKVRSNLKEEQLEALWKLEKMLIFLVERRDSYHSHVTVNIMPIEQDTRELEYIERRNLRSCIKGIYVKIISENAIYYVHVESEPIYEKFCSNFPNYKEQGLEVAYNYFRQWFLSQYKDRTCPFKYDFKKELNF